MICRDREQQAVCGWGSTQPISDEAGWRFASLVDGEGCFTIHRNVKTGCWETAFVIVVRNDDRDFIERIRTRLGDPGTLTRVERARPGFPMWMPQTRWKIGSKAETRWLVDVLDAFPLWSKKQRDYAVWRKAILARSEGRGAGHDVLADCFHEIRRVREYVEPEARP